VQRGDQLTAADPGCGSQHRVLIIEIDARRGLDELEVQAHQLADVVDGAWHQPEPLGERASGLDASLRVSGA
jgi:hypothetical protein